MFAFLLKETVVLLLVAAIPGVVLALIVVLLSPTFGRKVDEWCRNDIFLKFLSAQARFLWKETKILLWRVPRRIGVVRFMRIFR